MSGQYEVLSPWAEVDSISLKGISPRVTDLAGKAIGLFENHKIAAGPILSVVERKLKERFPTSKFSWYLRERRTHRAPETRFEEWAKGIDAAVLTIGN